jgi:GPH family glycoside/pentoside/hexuronide:cation symporter
MSEKLSGKQISGKQIFGYLSGWVPTTLLVGIFSLAYIKFFFDQLGMDPLLFIIGMIIYMIINMINDPLIGYWSDNTDAKKWGSRRLVFIKYFSPILVIWFIIMWFPWSVTNDFVIFIHFLISVCTFDTLANIVIMTWLALLPDMTQDIDERTKISFLGSIIILFASLIIITVPIMVNNIQFFQFFNIFIAAISIVCYLLVLKLSKERPEFQADKSPPLGTAIKQTFKSKAFLTYIGYNFTKGVNGSIQLSYLFVFLILVGEEFIIFYFLIVIIFGYSANIICMKLRSRYGVKKLMIRFGLIQGIGGFIIFFLILIPAIEIPTIWAGLLFSTFFGGAGVFTIILQTLPIDEDEVKYGHRRETMFYGINALFTKPAESLGPIIATIILVSFSYIQGGSPAVQPESAILGIKILFYVIPNIFVLIGLIFIHYFPLEGEKYEQLQADLRVLHQKKRKRLDIK